MRPRTVTWLAIAGMFLGGVFLLAGLFGTVKGGGPLGLFLAAIPAGIVLARVLLSDRVARFVGRVGDALEGNRWPWERP